MEAILRRKMRRYLEELSRKRVESREGDDIIEKAKPIFSEDGYRHLRGIWERSRELGEEILKILLQLTLMGILSPPIGYVEVERLRRRLMGEKGRIYVYKRGELKELGEAIKKD